MKMNLTLKYMMFAVLAVLCIALGSRIAETATYWKTAGFQSNSKFTAKLWAASDFSVSGNQDTTGTATFRGMMTRKGQIQTDSAVSLTSPTTTFNVAGLGAITLNLDANETGVRPTGGTKGQHILVRMGTGTNTARLDSGASMTLNGSNLTFTEGQNDNFELECTNTEGDEWRLLWQNGGS